MRGSKRTQTKRRVVGEAARLFREGGLEGTGIDAVMRAAQLTHGGFYAHFRGKEALAADAISAAFDQACKNLFGFDGNGPAWRERAGKRYLSRSHVESPGEGCALPTLGVPLLILQALTTRQVLRSVLLVAAQRAKTIKSV